MRYLYFFMYKIIFLLFCVPIIHVCNSSSSFIHCLFLLFFWLLFIFIFLLNILLLFYYSCLNFSSMALLCPAHPPTPTVIPNRVVHVHGSFMYVPWLFPFFPPWPLSPQPLVTVNLFLISMPLVLFCLLVYFGY